MAEGKQYYHLISGEMETEGIDKGRLKNTDFTRELAEEAKYGMDQSTLDYKAKRKLAESVAHLEDVTKESIATRALHAHDNDGDYPDAIAKTQREAAHRDVDITFDRINEVADQYDELQAAARDIRDIHKAWKLDENPSSE